MNSRILAHLAGKNYGTGSVILDIVKKRVPAVQIMPEYLLAKDIELGQRLVKLPGVGKYFMSKEPVRLAAGLKAYINVPRASYIFDRLRTSISPAASFLGAYLIVDALNKHFERKKRKEKENEQKTSIKLNF